MADRDYSHNHYVPEWYQRRFLHGGEGKFHYLDMRPEAVTREGHTYFRKSLLRWGPPSCFAQHDLYTTFWGRFKNVDIEKYFFGKVDTDGKRALEFLDEFDIRDGLHQAFENLVRFMSVQKLRTPKGLRAFAELVSPINKTDLLLKMQEYATLHCATWTDAIWQIVDASNSPTKFIVSDHPVTVYNRACFPGSPYCRDYRDPSILMTATQTVFPFSLDKALFLTNLTWVGNPYQTETKMGPNPKLFRTAMFNATDIQMGRLLTEREVTEVNYIIKKRAWRYIASAERDWLYPEEHLPSTHWSKFGRGYLLMPDPRDIHMGGTVYVGYKDGTSEAWDEYGRRPWQRSFEDKKRATKESGTLSRFQDEFAALFGPEWRGWSHSFGRQGPRVDSPEFYQRHVGRARRHGAAKPKRSS